MNFIFLILKVGPEKKRQNTLPWGKGGEKIDDNVCVVVLLTWWFYHFGNNDLIIGKLMIICPWCMNVIIFLASTIQGYASWTVANAIDADTYPLVWRYNSLTTSFSRHISESVSASIFAIRSLKIEERCQCQKHSSFHPDVNLECHSLHQTKLQLG